MIYKLGNDTGQYLYRLNPFTPKSDRFQIFPCSLTSSITSHSMENLAFHSFTQMQDYYTSNSHYLTYTLLFKRLWECTFWTWEWKGKGARRTVMYLPLLICIFLLSAHCCGTCHITQERIQQNLLPVSLQEIEWVRASQPVMTIL